MTTEASILFPLDDFKELKLRLVKEGVLSTEEIKDRLSRFIKSNISLSEWNVIKDSI